MKDVELREGTDEASERPVALNQGRVGEESDGALSAKHDDVVAVIPEDMVRFLHDHVRQIHGLTSFHFLEVDDVCDGPLVHRGAALLFDLHRAHTTMVESVNFDRFNIN